ncbi:MAG: chromosomal replication initiator protein DnaA [Chlamydiota bacterium]|nr:chromosomal replication initiator protein DnaA [Chlamydiota bacterium]
MKAWENFLTLQEIELGMETVRKWLRPLKIVHFDACNLYLEAKDSFQILWFEEHIRPKVKVRLLNNNNKQIKVHLSVSNSNLEKRKTKEGDKSKQDSALPPFRMTFDSIDPQCRFENIIITQNNELAVKVLAESVGYNPNNQSYDQTPTDDPVFNPIYIFGQAGAGKTHLLMATSHALRRQGCNVIYARAETFTAHVVTAIRAGEMSTFRQAYRNIDALILDDVHIFSRKGATQEELFHTFNTLHLARKPIILSANCPPSDLQHIEPRLVSRFEWGISLEIPSYTKGQVLEIIKHKAESLSFHLRPDIAEYLVETFVDTATTIKALEALILRTHLNSKTPHFSPTTLTVPLVKNSLKDLIVEKDQKAITPQKIIKSVAEHYGIMSDDILGKSQSRECARARKLAMYIIREELNLSYVKIGDVFERDHSTVISSVRGINKSLEEGDEEVKSSVRSVQKMLKDLA